MKARVPDVSTSTSRDHRTACPPGTRGAACASAPSSVDRAAAANSAAAAVPTSAPASPRAGGYPIASSASGPGSSDPEVASSSASPSPQQHPRHPQRQTRRTATSADVLLRSLELRESVEQELLHAVDKLVNLRSRGDAKQFRLHVARLSAQEDQIASLQSSVDNKDADAHALRRQVAELEQRNAEQMVQLMTLKTELHANNVEMSTDRMRQVQRKDEEIAELNAMLGEAESATAQQRQTCDALRRQLKTVSEERDRLSTALRNAETDFEKRQAALLDETTTLRARASHAEDYRETANRQLADAEDASSQQHHDNLRLKASIAKLEVRLTEQNQEVERLRAQIQDADAHLKSSMARDKKQRESSDADRAQLKALREEIVALGTASQDASAERQLQDARKQISSLQNILAETHQLCQATEKRMHDSERRHAEKDAALRKMRSEKDEAARNAQDRISRLENNVRVLCQNIENSNSIMVMRKSSGVLLGDPDGDVDESFKLRRMDLAKMGVAEDQDDEERQRSILQQAGTVAREDHTSETAFEAAKGRRAELLREEMQRWHVGQQMGKSGGGGAETACAEIRDSEGSDHAPPKVSDARRRYLESMQREALKLAQKNQHRKKKVARKGIAREAGEPYKTRPPLKKSTKKREEGGRMTVFG